MDLRKQGKDRGLDDQTIDRLTDLNSNKELVRALAKLIETYVKDQELAVIGMSSLDGADKVFRAKVRAEGARALMRDIENLTK